MKMEQTECSETLAFKLQTPRNKPEERIRHSKHGKSFKSRIDMIIWTVAIAMLVLKPVFISDDEFTCPFSETSCLKETITTDRDQSNKQVYCNFRNSEMTTPPTLFITVQASYP
jgi:hypothetical protein